MYIYIYIHTYTYVYSYIHISHQTISQLYTPCTQHLVFFAYLKHSTRRMLNNNHQRKTWWKPSIPQRPQPRTLDDATSPEARSAAGFHKQITPKKDRLEWQIPMNDLGVPLF